MTSFDHNAIPAEKVIDCDVRPILRAGGEPFGVIMKSIAAVPEDGALRLSATFKPAPLFTVLGKQGFQHWIERGVGDDWVVWFYRGEGSGEATPIPKDEILLANLQKNDEMLQTRLVAEEQTWTLDVRQLSPPEPMELTLRVLEKLPAGFRLVQINERVPQFLIPLAEERGFKHRVLEMGETEVHIEFTRA